MSFVNTIDEQGDAATLSALLSGTQEEFKDDRVLYLSQGAFTYNKGLKRIDLPNVNTIWTSCFDNCWDLREINFPSLEMLQNYGLQSCYGLTTVSFPSLTSTKTNMLRYDPLVGIVSAPNVTVLNSYASGEQESAAGFDFTKKVTIATNAFNNAWRMFSLILRSPEVCTLQNTAALTNNPIYNGLGYIYVPSDLVSSYKSAANWSLYASQIVPISEFPKRPVVSGTITDDWDTIFANEANGTYSTKYSVGDKKLLKINDSYLIMQIVAKDTDDLADNSGKAKLTWLSVGLIGNLPMNLTNSSSGNWANSWLRKVLREKVLPNIETIVQNAIKPVIKYTSCLDDSSVRTTEASEETIWIPSDYEMFATATYENSGPTYTSFFTSNATRVKRRGIFPLNSGEGSTTNYRLRTTNSIVAAQFRGVAASGSSTNLSSNGTGYGIAIGFCT